MKRRIMLLLCAAASALIGSRAHAAVSAAQARELATTYFLCYVGFCGGTEEAIEREAYWEVPFFIGEAAATSGSIHVDKRSGMLSYSYGGQSYPTVTPAQLERCGGQGKSSQ